MDWVTTGMLNKQIAGRMNLSEVTVKVHRHNLMSKLGAKSVPDLVKMGEALRQAGQGNDTTFL
jgi:FixJ family two-component response regulator